MKHKWYNEIIAFASGIEIEVKHQGYEWEKADNLMYIDNDKIQYRIKPQLKQKKYLYAYIFNGKAMLTETKADDAIVAWTGCVASSGKYIGKIEVQDD